MAMTVASLPPRHSEGDSMPTPAPTSISPAVMPLVSPHALLYASLAQQPPIRCSGREPSQSRPISINNSSLTNADGSTLIKIGKTAAVCGVRAELLPIHQIASYRVNGGLSAGRSEESREEEENDVVIRNHNLLVPNVELSTGCSPFHLPGSPPSQEAQSLSQRILSLLHTLHLVRLSDLCIYDESEGSVADNFDNNRIPTSCSDATSADEEEDGTHESTTVKQERNRKVLKAFWVLYIDTIIINHDGNLFDACILAIFSALRDTTLPKSWWDPELESVICSPERHQARNLDLRGCPIPLSFCVFRPNLKLEHRRDEKKGLELQQEQQIVLCDPDAFEEGCCRERGCVTVDLDREGGKREEAGVVVIKIEKHGGGGLGGAGLRELVVRRAAQRWKEWQQLLTGKTSVPF